MKSTRWNWSAATARANGPRRPWRAVPTRSRGEVRTNSVITAALPAGWVHSTRPASAEGAIGGLAISGAGLEVFVLGIELLLCTACFAQQEREPASPRLDTAGFLGHRLRRTQC